MNVSHIMLIVLCQHFALTTTPSQTSFIHDGKTFISAEHFYQYQMCMYCNHQDAAEKVHAAPNAKAAKDIASDLKAKLTAPILAGWIKTRVLVMEETLKLKWNCCGKFRQALMATMGTTIVEATQDTFWGVGAAPNDDLAEETDSNHFLGFNQLGRILCLCVAMLQSMSSTKTTRSMSSSLQKILQLPHPSLLQRKLVTLSPVMNLNLHPRVVFMMCHHPTHERMLI